METFKGKVRKILENGKKVQIARSHSICEIYNTIPDLKIGDLVECNWQQTISKLPEKPKNKSNNLYTLQ